MKITEVLTAEHQIFLSVFEQIERALPSLTTLAEIRAMAGILEGVLPGHAAKEADLAYLVLDHVLADRGQLQRMHHDHAEFDARLKKVSATSRCAEARRLLRQVFAGYREHFRVEEREVFPLIERVLQPETLEELARPWTEARLEAAPAARG